LKISLKIHFLLLVINLVLFNSISAQTFEYKDLYFAKKYNQSLKVIDSLISLNKCNPELHLWKSYNASKLKDYNKSLDAINYSLDNCQKPVDSIYKELVLEKSFSLALMGDFNEAILICKNLTLEYPTDADLKITLSYLNSENSNIPKAIEILVELYEVDSLNVTVLNNLAFYYVENNEYNRSIYFANKGLRIVENPTRKGTLLNSKGYAIALGQDPKLGLEIINNSLEFYPDNPYAFFNIGVVNLHLEKLEKACENFNKAKELGAINRTKQAIELYCEY
jgi:hypothetical protein